MAYNGTTYIIEPRFVQYIVPNSPPPPSPYIYNLPLPPGMNPNNFLPTVGPPPSFQVHAKYVSYSIAQGFQFLHNYVSYNQQQQLTHAALLRPRDAHPTATIAPDRMPLHPMAPTAAAWVKAQIRERWCGSRAS